MNPFFRAMPHTSAALAIIAPFVPSCRPTTAKSTTPQMLDTDALPIAADKERKNSFLTRVRSNSTGLAIPLLLILHQS